MGNISFYNIRANLIEFLVEHIDWIFLFIILYWCSVSLNIKLFIPKI